MGRRVKAASTKAPNPPTPVPVTQRAVIQRINRKLTGMGQRLCATELGWRHALGRYYVRDGTGVVRKDVDLSELARELGVLAPFERIDQSAA